MNGVLFQPMCQQRFAWIWKYINFVSVCALLCSDLCVQGFKQDFWPGGWGRNDGVGCINSHRGGAVGRCAPSRIKCESWRVYTFSDGLSSPSNQQKWWSCTMTEWNMTTSNGKILGVGKSKSGGVGGYPWVPPPHLYKTLACDMYCDEVCDCLHHVCTGGICGATCARICLWLLIPVNCCITVLFQGVTSLCFMGNADDIVDVHVCRDGGNEDHVIPIHCSTWLCLIYC